MSVAIADSEESFDQLEGVWDRLVDRSDCTIFQTFEWVRTWWKYFGEGRELHCVVFKDADDVVGIVPLFFEKVRTFGVKFVTALRMCGAEESDYLNVVSSEQNRPRVLRAFVEYLRSADLKFDFFEIRDVSESFDTMRLLPEYLGESGFKFYTYKGTVCPQVSLPSSWPEFLQHLGGNLRYQLKKKTDRMKKNFNVEFQLAGNSEAEVEAAVREFSVIHGERWESMGYLNAFRNEHFLAFHIEVSQKFARRGWLRMYFLSVDGKRVAVNFDFNFRKRIYFYHGNAFGPEEVMKYSPGFLLRCAAIEDGIAEGMEVYDMLRGNETYKANDFKCVPIGNYQIRAVRTDGNGEIRFKLFTLSEILQKIPKRLKREFQDFRRFSKTKEPSASMVVRFLWKQVEELGELVRQTLLRLLPSSKRKQ